MQKSRHHQLNVKTVTAGGDQFRNFKQMIEIRLARRALAFLLRVFFRRKAGSSQNAPD
jgi:hypothetical protein